MGTVTRSQPLHTERLANAVGRLGFFALAFGSVVGSGWVVVLGSWLEGGPGAAVVGFIAGAIVMTLVALCYGELAAASTAAGGEFLYVRDTLGRGAGFIVGWFLTLYGVALCAFEGIVLGWLLRTLLPAIAGGTAYVVAGTPITWDALAIGWTGAILIGGLHYRGASTAIAFQTAATVVFIAATLVLILCALALGKASNFHPLFADAESHAWWAGATSVFAMCAFFLNGWQTALHAIEERRTDITVPNALSSIVWGLVMAALFYCAIVLSAASAQPWQELVGAELPAVSAFASLGLSGYLGSLVLVAAVISISKTWNAIAWVATRLIFAQARSGVLPSELAGVSPTTGAPRFAIVMVTLACMAGVSLGRGAILPIVNMVSTCLGISIVLCLLVLIRRYQRGEESAAFRTPGGVATIIAAMLGAGSMVLIAIIQPLLDHRRGIPLEWKLMGTWLMLGAVFWLLTSRRRRSLLGG